MPDTTTRATQARHVRYDQWNLRPGLFLEERWPPPQGRGMTGFIVANARTCSIQMAVGRGRTTQQGRAEKGCDTAAAAVGAAGGREEERRAGRSSETPPRGRRANRQAGRPSSTRVEDATSRRRKQAALPALLPSRRPSGKDVQVGEKKNASRKQVASAERDSWRLPLTVVIMHVRTTTGVYVTGSAFALAVTYIQFSYYTRFVPLAGAMPRTMGTLHSRTAGREQQQQQSINLND
jgi:hypothetical protein